MKKNLLVTLISFFSFCSLISGDVEKKDCKQSISLFKRDTGYWTNPQDEDNKGFFLL